MCATTFLLTRPSRDVTGTSRQVWLTKPEFLLTRPSRDVTRLKEIWDRTGYISTHTPLAGRD